MKTNVVNVAKNSQNGLVFTPGTVASKDKKTYGFYIVEQIGLNEEGGFIKKEKRSALLTVENSLGIEVNYKEGHVKVGNIVRHESLTPFFDGQEPVINPTTKAVVLRNGQPLFRQDQYTSDLTKMDKLIPIAVATPVVAISGLAD